MFLRKTLYALVTPPSIFFIGLLIVWLFFYKRWSSTLLILICSLFYLMSMPFTADALHKRLNTYSALTKEELRASDAQAIVLLSGGIYGFNEEYDRNMPNADSILRALYATEVAKRTRLPILVTGGGQRDDQQAGAAIIQNFMQLNLKQKVRWTETNSNTTLENALFSKELLNTFDIDNIIVVTQSWHMPRAVAAFEAMGFTVTPAPTYASKTSYSYNRLDQFVPTANDFRRTQTALHEILGMLWYRYEIPQRLEISPSLEAEPVK